MSYLGVIKIYEPQIGKKFTYEDAIAFWTALNEPYKLQVDHHLKCSNVKDSIAKSQENCDIEKSLYSPMDNSKKLALSFFNKTLNNSALFPKDAKDKFLKEVRNTFLFKKIDGQIGGYYEKYLKYKSKYLTLKAELKGGDVVIDCAGKDWRDLYSPKIQSTKKLIDELEVKLKNHTKITVDEAKVYLSAIEAIFARNQECKSLKLEDATCSNDIARVKPLYKKFIAEIKPYWKTVNEELIKYAPNLSGYLKDHI